ncbi:MAG TPA: NAD(P)H-dependent oxidoreductase [Mycobacteriales bacterium]|nr:NAD(P)H-dependent oxidoreductase [Mycobacteriales bacterium]
MARLLVVHHTPSPATQEMLEAVLAGARDDAIDGVELAVVPALVAGPVDVLEADGYLLGTPANIGYISGALKHFFDTIYYPVLEATKDRPFAAYVHGNLGTEGAVRAIETITTGLGWKPVSKVVTVEGAPGRADRDALYELGATLAATLASR